MKTVSLTIDGKKITARHGENLLEAALANGIYIPNLCFLRDMEEPAAACRLCFLEIAGREYPVTACTETVFEGMEANTKGEKALRLARTGFQLLMASHRVDCASCAGNGSCELQRIARHLGVRLKQKRFRNLTNELSVDTSSSLFIFDPNKCVLCGRCVWLCHEQVGAGVLGFAHRGFNRVVATFGGKSIGESACRECTECVSVCPTGALALK